MREIRYRNKEKRDRKLRKIKIVSKCVLFIILFIILFMILKIRGKYQTYIKDSINLKNNNQNVFIHQNLKKHNLIVTYPKLNNDKINNKVAEIVDSIINENKSINNVEIQYNMYNIKDQYISLQLIIKINNNIKLDNYIFSQSSGEMLDNDYFLKEEKIAEFNKIIKDKLSSNSKYLNSINDNNKYSLLIKNNDIEIDFSPNKECKDINDYPVIYISLNDLKDIVIDDILPSKTSEIISLKEQMLLKKESIVPQRTINSGRKLIALTFDDGPHATFTNEILETLKKYNGAATFFVLGSRAVNYPNVISNIINSGSEIGNHSWSHPQLTKLSVSQMKKEIDDTQNTVYNASKVYPKFVRPPYGAVNISVKSNIGMPMILWNVDTLDWKTKNTQMILNEIMNNARDGSIILMHDIHKTSKEAAILTIPKLVNQGFELVTVSELFKAKGVSLEAGKTYTNL